MDALTRDLRHALRQLRRSPGFAAVAILTLALGIGATTVIFSVAHATLLRPPPFQDAERLVFLQGYARTPEGPRVRGAAFAEIRDWERMSRSFEELVVVDGTSLNLVGREGAERVPAEFVSPGYFDFLGVSPLRGRTFLPERGAAPGTAPVAVIGEDLWERRFGRDEAVIGRTVRLNDRPLTVVGVVPGHFGGAILNAEVWVPTAMMWELGADGGPDDRENRFMAPMARLREGVSVAEARADMDAVAAALEETHPAYNRDRGVFVTPLRDVYLGSTGTLVAVLLGAVALLLTLACTNVANLLLARATSRRRDVLMRIALGAPRSRLVRHFLTEGVVLASAGAALGLVLAVWAVRGLETLVPAGLLPAYTEVSMNAPVFAFAVVLTALTGLVSGTAPAVVATRADVMEGLRLSARAVAAGHGARLRQALAAGQVALALVLVVGAILMARSFGRQLAVGPGYDADAAVAFRLELPEMRYEREEVAQFARELEARLEGLPGVESATAGSTLPLRDRASASILRLPSRPDDGFRFYRHQVTAGYFRTLGIPIRRGRPFEQPDANRDVVVASRSLAARLFGPEDAVGRTIILGYGEEARPFRIVGVAEDVRYRDLTSRLVAGEDDPDLYLPFDRFPDRSFDVAVRTLGSPADLTTAVRSAVAALDPTLPVFDLAPLMDELRAETAQGRFGAALLAWFSGLALLLAAVGIYGVMAFMVGQRAREIAIRMALGAEEAEVQRMVLRRSGSVAALGLGAGVVGALALSRFLRSFLFQVRTTDVATYAGALLVLSAVVLVSSWVPARRAARLDAAATLKGE